MSAGRLRRIHRGVYAVGAPWLSREGRWLAAVLRAGPGAVLNHRSAAALWDLRPTSAPRIEVTVPATSGRRSTAAIVVHHSTRLAVDTTSRHGIPVTSPARTLADLAVAQVVKTGQSHCVPFRCSTGVLVVREGKASAPDNEFKYYAAGVGQIDNVPRSASMHKDVEKLINLTQLTPRGLAEASVEALKLDAHARTTRPGHGPAARRTR